jgi:hypothetical protein
MAVVISTRKRSWRGPARALPSLHRFELVMAASS